MNRERVSIITVLMFGMISQTTQEARSLSLLKKQTRNYLLGQ